jgi:hypothetical protein
MAEAKIDSFAEMDHINSLVEIYEQKTGNHLRIKRSINGKFRVYQCREYINCPFEIHFLRRRSDGMYTVSRMKTRHAERDKGLKEAVKQVFPTNLEFSCAQHIRANVTQRFGRNASKYVMAIAKTYSARYVELLMDKIK